MSKGKCYGVSVGPGAPDLLTIRVVNTIRKADIIFLPSAPKETCKVYQIIKGALPDLDEDKYVCVETDKMADPKSQGERYDLLAKKVSEYLDKGLNVAFPALGEVCLYSTYMYVYVRLSNLGYECENISGVSSVQETANRMMISLAQGDEEVHVFPDTNNLKEKLHMPGTKVFMKPKGDLNSVISEIKEYVNSHPKTEAYGISRCGAENEVLAKSFKELDMLNGYMTVIIVK